MVSQVAVAIERDEAITRINSVLERLASAQGHEYASIPTQGKDQSIVNKNQLVYIAQMLDDLFAPAKEITDAEDATADNTPAPLPTAETDTLVQPLRLTKGKR